MSLKQGNSVEIKFDAGITPLLLSSYVVYKPCQTSSTHVVNKIFQTFGKTSSQ